MASRLKVVSEQSAHVGSLRETFPCITAIHTNVKFGEALDDLRGIMVSLGISEALAFHSNYLPAKFKEFLAGFSRPDVSGRGGPTIDCATWHAARVASSPTASRGPEGPLTVTYSLGGVQTSDFLSNGRFRKQIRAVYANRFSAAEFVAAGSYP